MKQLLVDPMGYCNEHVDFMLKGYNKRNAPCSVLSMGRNYKEKCFVLEV